MLRVWHLLFIIEPNTNHHIHRLSVLSCDIHRLSVLSCDIHRLSVLSCDIHRLSVLSCDIQLKLIALTFQ